MNNNSSCVVLVPASGMIEPDTEKGLSVLESRGYRVVRGRGCSQIDLMRSQMATDFLAQGFAETLWIDSDVGFNADDVDRIRRHKVPICAGLYPKKGQRSLAARMLPNTQSVRFGTRGGLIEIQYAATGFLHVRREVYDKVRGDLRLPTCNRSAVRPVVPYFLPLIVQEGEESMYLSEDFSFCERARQVGYKVLADTSVRLWHIGAFRFSWEEAALGVPRCEDIVMEFQIDGSTVSNGYAPEREEIEPMATE